MRTGLFGSPPVGTPSLSILLSVRWVVKSLYQATPNLKLRSH
jgi:hypothetical protein